MRNQRNSGDLVHAEIPVCGQARRVRRMGGFSIVELLVVIAVMLIVAALLLPAISKSKERSRSTACLSNLRQIGMSLQLYVTENENRLPIMYDAIPGVVNPTNAVPTMDRVLSNYLGNARVLLCPSDTRGLFLQTRSSYAWNFLVNDDDAEHLSVFSIEFDPQNVPLIYDKEAFHVSIGRGRGVNYLYADGHIHNLLAIEGTRSRTWRKK